MLEKYYILIQLSSLYICIFASELEIQIDFMTDDNDKYKYKSFSFVYF